MENENKNLETQNQDNQNTDTNIDNEDYKAKFEEQQLELEKLKAERDRFKTSIDKLTHEAAENKKAQREKMSEDERLKAEREELDQQNAEKIKSLEAEVAKNKNIKTYLKFGLSEEDAEKCATLQVEGDTEKILEIVKKQHEADLKAKENEYLKNRPDPVVGGDDKEADPFIKGFNAGY